MSRSDIDPTRSVPMLSGAVIAFAGLFACLSLGPAQASEEGGHGGGWGIGIAIDVTRIIQDQARRERRGKTRKRRSRGRPAHKTVRKPLKCEKPSVYYKRRHKCVCPRKKGLEMISGQCVPIIPTSTIVRIQECLTLAGYDAGKADGRAGPRTASAFRAFKTEHELGARPGDIRDTHSVERLFQICETPDYGLVKAAEREDGTAEHDEAGVPVQQVVLVAPGE